MLRNWWVLEVLSNHGPVFLAAWCVWVILSITLHELAHGWAAISRGDRTPIDSGHMTYNPLVHLGPTSLLVFALCGIAWGAMPIDPTRMRGRYAEAWVAFCGPLTNFVLAGICVIFAGIALGLKSAGVLGQGGESKVLENATIFLQVGAMLNVALGIFNLIPILPLDGGRMVSNYSRRYREFTETQAGQFMAMISFVVAFFLAGAIVFRVGVTASRIGTQTVMAAVEFIARAVGVSP